MGRAHAELLIAAVEAVFATLEEVHVWMLPDRRWHAVEHGDAVREPKVEEWVAGVVGCWVAMVWGSAVDRAVDRICNRDWCLRRERACATRVRQ